MRTMPFGGGPSLARKAPAPAGPARHAAHGTSPRGLQLVTAFSSRAAAPQAPNSFLHEHGAHNHSLARIMVDAGRTAGYYVAHGHSHQSAVVARAGPAGGAGSAASGGRRREEEDERIPVPEGAVPRRLKMVRSARPPAQSPLHNIQKLGIGRTMARLLIPAPIHASCPHVTSLTWATCCRWWRTTGQTSQGSSSSRGKCGPCRCVPRARVCNEMKPEAPAACVPRAGVT
jgi:hypothetical protein